MGKSQRMSTKAADATEGGGGLSGARFEIKEIEYVQEFEYPGSSGNGASAALRVVYEIEGHDKEWERHYTLGKSDRFTVIEDGNAIEGPGLNKNSNAFRWFEAAEEADGYDGFHDDGTISDYVGKTGTIKTIPYVTANGDQAKYPLIAIGSFDDGTPTKKNGKTSSNGKSAVAGARTSTKGGKVSLEEKAQAAAAAVVNEEEKVKKGDLPGLVFAANKKDPDAKAIMQLCFKESFLANIPGVEYDKKKGVLTPAETSDDEDE